MRDNARGLGSSLGASLSWKVSPHRLPLVPFLRVCSSSRTIKTEDPKPTELLLKRQHCWSFDHRPSSLQPPDMPPGGQPTHWYPHSTEPRSKCAQSAHRGYLTPFREYLQRIGHSLTWAPSSFLASPITLTTLRSPSLLVGNLIYTLCSGDALRILEQPVPLS